MILGIVSAVPKRVVVNDDETFVRATGVKERRIVEPHQNLLTLAEAAASRLMFQLGKSAADVDQLVFVTQTPIYRMPSMACILAGRLGVDRAAFDVNQACAGYIHGLAQTRYEKRTLLITGDTVSRMAPLDDKLFGDCVAATWVEDPIEPIATEFGTDGRGYDKLIADPTIRMDGVEVMNFALQKVPELVNTVTMAARCDFYLFHQANRMILKRVAQKCRLEPTKVPMNIHKYGNTSSASIPLLMCDSEATPELLGRGNRVAMFGFGAGWSWGGVMLQMDPLQCAEVIEV